MQGASINICEWDAGGFWLAAYPEIAWHSLRHAIPQTCFTLDMRQWDFGVWGRALLDPR